MLSIQNKDYNVSHSLANMVPQIANKNTTKLSMCFRSCSLVMLCLDAGNSNSTDSTSEDTGFSKAELTHFRYKQGFERDSETLASKDQAAPPSPPAAPPHGN
jgi:hypothetical protein